MRLKLQMEEYDGSEQIVVIRFGADSHIVFRSHQSFTIATRLPRNRSTRSKLCGPFELTGRGVRSEVGVA